MDALGEALVLAQDQLDAVTAAGSLHLARAGNGVRMGFEGAQSRNPQVNVLASSPVEVDVLDGDDGG